MLYALESSFDYDPGPALEKIKAPLFAINSADDLVNPPEIGLLEKEITRVPKGRAIVIPLSDKTAGHGTHTLAAVWKAVPGGAPPTDNSPVTAVTRGARPSGRAIWLLV